MGFLCIPDSFSGDSPPMHTGYIQFKEKISLVASNMFHHVTEENFCIHRQSMYFWSGVPHELKSVHCDCMSFARRQSWWCICNSRCVSSMFNSFVLHLLNNELHLDDLPVVDDVSVDLSYQDTSNILDGNVDQFCWSREPCSVVRILRAYITNALGYFTFFYASLLPILWSLIWIVEIIFKTTNCFVVCVESGWTLAALHSVYAGFTAILHPASCGPCMSGMSIPCPYVRPYIAHTVLYYIVYFILLNWTYVILYWVEDTRRRPRWMLQHLTKIHYFAICHC